MFILYQISLLMYANLDIIFHLCNVGNASNFDKPDFAFLLLMNNLLYLRLINEFYLVQYTTFHCISSNFRIS